MAGVIRIIIPIVFDTVLIAFVVVVGLAIFRWAAKGRK